MIRKQTTRCHCALYLLQIQVSYTKPKTFVLTPSRKHLGKALTRKSQRRIAAETLKSPLTRSCVLNNVGREVQNEIVKMASDKTGSILKTESMKELEWSAVVVELRTNAPVLISTLQAATKTRVCRSNTNAVVGRCAAILLKHRNPKMSLV